MTTPIGTPPLGVHLRVEHDLRVHDALAVGTVEVGVGQVVEVLLGTQGLRPAFVQVEERLEVAEVVRGAELVDGVVRQMCAVATRELEGELRLEGALNVQVQLRLGQGAHQCAQVVVGHGPASDRLVRQVGAHDRYTAPGTRTVPSTASPVRRSRPRASTSASSAVWLMTNR
jgi:hypothetical protein